MSPADFMKQIYLTLLEQEWTLQDIDEMDFFYYLDLLIFKAKQQAPRATIDQVF